MLFFKWAYLMLSHFYCRYINILKYIDTQIDYYLSNIYKKCVGNIDSEQIYEEELNSQIKKDDLIWF